MTYIATDTETVLAGEALEAHRLILITSGEAKYSDSTNTPYAVTLNKCADAEYVAVKRLNTAGTLEIEAADTFSVGATLYCTADGKVTDTDAGSDVKVGLAKEACTAAGDIIEVYPIGLVL